MRSTFDSSKKPEEYYSEALIAFDKAAGFLNEQLKAYKILNLMSEEQIKEYTININLEKPDIENCQASMKLFLDRQNNIIESDLSSKFDDHANQPQKEENEKLEDSFMEAFSEGMDLLNYGKMQSNNLYDTDYEITRS